MVILWEGSKISIQALTQVILFNPLDIRNK